MVFRLSVLSYSLVFQLEPDLDFTHHNLLKDCKGLKKHAITFSKAFWLVDYDRPNPERKQAKPHNKQSECINESYIPLTVSSSSIKSDKRIPICIYGLDKAKGCQHFLKACTNFRMVRRRVSSVQFHNCK